MKTKIQSLLTAVLVAAALTAFACGRPAAETKTAENQPAPAVTAAPVPAPAPPVPAQTNELRPEPRSVTISEATPAPSPSQADLDAKARDLAKRQAALDAREKALRDRERRAPKPQPVPDQRAEAPAAPEMTAPEPQPAEPEPAPLPEPEPEPRPAPRPEPVTVPAGTVMNVEMLTTISSESSKKGDLFRARIAGSVRTDGGEVAIPAGSEVVGEVTEAAAPGKIGGQAKLGIHFTDLVLPDGTTVPLEASFVQSGRSKTGRDAATIGGGAAGGAILGHAIGKGGRGSVIGAILGAVVGTVVASRTPGEQVSFTQGTAVDIKLDSPIRVQPRDLK